MFQTKRATSSFWDQDKVAKTKVPKKPKEADQDKSDKAAAATNDSGEFVTFSPFLAKAICWDS